MSRKEKHRESRFFTGGEKELQDIKVRERLQKLQRKKEARQRFSKAVRAVLFIVLSVVFVFVCLSVFFRVSYIEIVGNTRYDATEILAVTEIETGTNLFKVSNKDIEPLLEQLAYIKNASVKRKLPDTIIITVEEDEAKYFADIYGQLFLLSGDLRVLERVERRAQIKDMQLVELVLPDISSALIGDRIVFPDDVTDKYVTSYVNALAESPLLEKTTSFDLRERFDLALIAEELYLVDLGTGTELATKLTVVAGMLDNAVFADKVPATIDAENPEQCSVIKKADLKVAFDD